ncbi:hypothetical protein [Enterobacter cancerogenus]|uniref:hypothetical protein n=1 Tax=Enterobacter cancerogenus TaxID=69218 RepID=UPI0010C23D4D|nr:hypothetical protein [Enterobacter cancerogenus]
MKTLTCRFSAHPKHSCIFQLIGGGLLKGSALHKLAIWHLTPETFLCAIDHIPSEKWDVIMSRTLEKDFLAGALLAEVVRQHPEIRLSPAFVDAVLIAANDICGLFNLETQLPEKTTRRRIV